MDKLFDLSSLIIQTINFVIIAVVLRKFFFVPYLAYLKEEMHKREDLEKSLADIHQIQSQANLDAESIRQEAREDAKKIRTQSQTLAEQEKQMVLALASQEADRIKDQAQSDVANLTKTLERDMKQKILTTAMALNKKLFGAKSEANADFLSEQSKLVK